jgi:hypothetical protein
MVTGQLCDRRVIRSGVLDLNKPINFQRKIV